MIKTQIRVVITLITTLFCLPHNLLSQECNNLVKDSSFEVQNGVIRGACDVFAPDVFNKNLQYWHSPTNGTPDLYSYNYADDGFLKPPVFDTQKIAKCFGPPYCNYRGAYRRYYIQPKTGNSFAGLLYAENTASGVSARYQREFIQTELRHKLKKNHKYEIGLSYIYFPYSYESQPFIDMLLTPGKIENIYTSDCYRNPDCSGFKQQYQPQVRIRSIERFTGDTGRWHTRSFEIRSRNEEAWLTLGRFKDTSSFYRDNMCGGKASYFYIDDIFVREIPAIISPDTVCSGSRMELTTTLGMPYYWASDPLGHHVICRDSVLRFEAKRSMTLYAFGRLGSDSFHLNVMLIPSPDWQDTVDICKGETALLKAGTSQYHYKWSNSFRDTAQRVDKQGYYTVMVSDNFGCQASYTTYLYVHEQPEIKLPADTQVCFETNGPLVLKAGENIYCEWSLEPGPQCTITVPVPGPVSVVAVSAFGCRAGQTINVTDMCEPAVFIPDAFGPHTFNGCNKVWKPVVNYVSSYEASVYNRWGQQLWHSDNPQEGWDGTFAGTDCEPGVYMAVVQVRGKFPYDVMQNRSAKAIQLVH